MIMVVNGMAPDECFEMRKMLTMKPAPITMPGEEERCLEFPDLKVQFPALSIETTSDLL